MNGWAVVQATRRPGERVAAPRMLITNAPEKVAREVFKAAAKDLRRGYVLLLDPAEACQGKITRFAEEVD